MRARLFSTSPDRRRPRSSRRGPGRRSPTRGSAPAPAPGDAQPPTADADVERAQHAGGPADVATYTCGCGYLFVAPVSTTVRCPHCDSDQAW